MRKKVCCSLRALTVSVATRHEGTELERSWQGGIDSRRCDTNPTQNRPLFLMARQIQGHFLTMADSDSDDSIIFRPAAARRCFAIADDSSSSGEESDSQSVEIVGMKQVVTTAGARAAGQRMDSLFSDDSGSLEAMLENLALKADDKKEEIMSGESDESFASDSSDEQGDDDDASDIATDIAVDSAWSFNKHDQEYFLSKRKEPSISWPNLRLPAHLFKSLYNHQKVGVQWMAKLHAEHIGGILGDDMGM